MPKNKTDPTAAGKAAKKTEVAKRRRDVAGLALAYVAQSAIAERLGVSVGTISSDMKAIRTVWQSEAILDRKAAAVREVHSLDRLEANLWSQFLNVTTRRVRVTKANGDEYQFEEPLVSVSDKTRTATVILKTKERRAKLLGLDEPDVLEIRLTSEQVQAEIAYLKEKHSYDGPRALPE